MKKLILVSIIAAASCSAYADLQCPVIAGPVLAAINSGQSSVDGFDVWVGNQMNNSTHNFEAQNLVFTGAFAGPGAGSYDGKQIVQCQYSSLANVMLVSTISDGQTFEPVSNLWTAQRNAYFCNSWGNANQCIWDVQN